MGLCLSKQNRRKQSPQQQLILFCVFSFSLSYLSLIKSQSLEHHFKKCLVKSVVWPGVRRGWSCGPGP